MWDTVSGKEILSFPESMGGSSWSHAIEGIAFAADGQTMASVNREGSLSLWDRRRGKRLFEVKNAGKWSGPIAFSPNGRSLAAATRARGVRLLETATGNERLSLADKAETRCLTFSADGLWLACGMEDGTLCLHHLPDGKLFHRFTGHQGAISTLAFSPDGLTLATGNSDATILLWKVPKVPQRVGAEVQFAPRQLDGLWADLNLIQTRRKPIGPSRA